MEKRIVSENFLTPEVKDSAILFNEGQKDLPINNAMLEYLKKALSNAIDELSYDERIILSLYYCEELTMTEIGEVLGIVQSKVRQIYSNAVLNLRGKFQLLG